MEYKIVDNNGNTVEIDNIIGKWQDGFLLGTLQDLFKGILHDLHIVPVVDVEKHPSIEVNPIIREGERRDYSLKAEVSGDPGIYEEISVSIYDKDGECVGDVYFTVEAETGEPEILLTCDGNGDGDKQITVYPLRERDKAVVYEVS